jgi:hypothetical protein
MEGKVYGPERRFELMPSRKSEISAQMQRTPLSILRDESHPSHDRMTKLPLFDALLFLHKREALDLWIGAQDYGGMTSRFNGQ